MPNSRKGTKKHRGAWLEPSVIERLREIKRERDAIQKRIDAARPDIERMAANGTAEERRVALRWLALDDEARRATA